MKTKTFLLPLLGISLLAITTCKVEEPCPNEDKIQERPFNPYFKACLPYKGNETLVFYDSARQDTFTLHGEGYVIDWDTVKTVGLDNACRETFKLEHTWLWFRGNDERQLLIEMVYEPFQRSPGSWDVNLQNNFAKISASTNVDNRRLSKAYTIDSIYVQSKLYANAFVVRNFGGGKLGRFIMNAENEFIKIDGIGQSWEIVEKK
ncbi:MAG: hypothetical protein FGM41_11060 [Bacteroidetes bacterium]|nr:hypothetical protein [Bacteroidota bacterium]